MLILNLYYMGLIEVVCICNMDGVEEEYMFVCNYIVKFEVIVFVGGMFWYMIWWVYFLEFELLWVVICLFYKFENFLVIFGSFLW